MANTIHLANHKFIRQPKIIKYLFVFLMILVASSLVYFWKILLDQSLWYFLLMPFFYILIPILEKPISILSGAKKYYSPLLIVWGKHKKKYSLHLGTLFDYLMALDFKAKSTTYKTQILIYFLEGVLNIIEELKKNENHDAKIFGTSYFLSKTTAERFGFKTKKATRGQILFLMLNYVNLVFLLSLSSRRISFPNLFHAMTLEIDAKTLIGEELTIRRSYEYLRARFLKAKAAQEKSRNSARRIMNKPLNKKVPLN